MNKSIELPSWLMIYGVCIPVALALGYLLATPDSLTSLLPVASVIGLLAFPILMRWHHQLLIIVWNAALIVYFLPGQPSMGMCMAGLGLFFALLNRSLRKGDEYLHVRSVAYSLIAILVIVGVTAYLTGGVGGRAFGSDTWGVKRYFTVFGAVMGYFALVSRKIQPQQANFLTNVYFLSGITAIISNIAFAAGPSLYFLFAFFPAQDAYLQAATSDNLTRLPGVTWAAMSIYYFMVAWYGLRGIFDLRKPWRLVSFLSVVGLSLLGGFRTSIVVISLIFVVQFYFERLYRTRLLPVLLLGGILCGTFVVAFIDRMPLSVQRSVSFLPLDSIDPMAKADAAGTLDWRLEMWRTLLPTVPQYLLVGKGFAFNGTDYLLTQEAMRRGMFTSFEDTLINGNYHNGILTLIIPFGIFGMLAFVWFCWASIRVLYANFKFGEQRLARINTFLLSYFVARLSFYLVLYGQFDLDLEVFTGVIGLSIALNGGVKRPVPVPVVHKAEEIPATLVPVMQT